MVNKMVMGQRLMPMVINKYVGEYKNGKKDGNGTYTEADGDKYVGPYKDGERHGQGTHTDADGTIETGEWVNGVDPNL